MTSLAIIPRPTEEIVSGKLNKHVVCRHLWLTRWPKDLLYIEEICRKMQILIHICILKRNFSDWPLDLLSGLGDEEAHSVGWYLGAPGVDRDLCVTSVIWPHLGTHAVHIINIYTHWYSAQTYNLQICGLDCSEWQVLGREYLPPEPKVAALAWQSRVLRPERTSSRWRSGRGSQYTSHTQFLK